MQNLAKRTSHATRAHHVPTGVRAAISAGRCTANCGINALALDRPAIVSSVRACARALQRDASSTRRSVATAAAAPDADGKVDDRIPVTVSPNCWLSAHTNRIGLVAGRAHLDVMPVHNVHRCSLASWALARRRC